MCFSCAHSQSHTAAVQDVCRPRGSSPRTPQHSKGSKAEPSTLWYVKKMLYQLSYSFPQCQHIVKYYLSHRLKNNNNNKKENTSSSAYAMLALVVPAQINLALEALWTNVTPEGLKSCVFPAVCDQVGALAESFATNLAFVRFFTYKKKMKHTEEHMP